MDGAAKRIAARRRNACRSRFAGRNTVRQRLSRQACQPSGPLRSVTPARSVTGGSRKSRATPQIWVKGLRLKNGAVGQQASRHALAYGKRAQKRSYSDGGMRYVQTKG